MVGFGSLSLLVCLAICAVNGQSLWQNAQCRKQMQAFLECKQKIFSWKELEERRNRSNAMYDECVEKNGCIKMTDLPHDLNWRKRKCSEDAGTVVKQKVVACVRLRVSPDFELPESNDWAYGRFSYEPVPLGASLLESMCKRGDYEGAKKCYMDTSNRSMMTPEERTNYFEKGCTRRSNCFKLLDDECLAKYDAYRQAFCECAFDVHEMYGGNRLLTLIPACAGLINDKKSKYITQYKQRDSCDLEDLNDRDSLYKICEVGYDKYLKELKEKAANMSTTTHSPTSTASTVKTSKGKATEAPIFVNDKGFAN